MIVIPWLVFLAVWMVGASFGKRTARRETSAERLFHMTGSAIAAFLVFSARTENNSTAREEIGLVLCAAGVAFAIGARVLLGTNWSGTVTLKQDHELIERGPYRLVRHPIYTGMLAGLLGTAVFYGQARCFAGFFLACFTFWKKSQIEETFMLDYFGPAYRDYQRRVKALLPGIL